MKNSKKLTAAVAVSAVATALVAPAAMAATTFTDITGNFAADAINALAAKGILSGNPDGTFAPNGNITREQFAVVLAKALNLDASGTSSFTDVDAWASGYVAAVSKAGFVSGYDATHFGGKDSLTREQMATILVRALTKQQGYDATGKGANLTFTDASSISSWAKDSVGAAVELGLIHGMTDGTFAPAANATRAQVALVTQAFMNVQINGVSVTASATLNSNNTATVTGKTTGSADSVKVTVDGGTAVDATLNSDGTYTYTTNQLASGSHTISVVAYKGTNASQPASATVTVGTVGVASVTATDAQHINVVFNTAMNTNADGLATNDASFFTLGGTAAPAISSVSWSADDKTATLNLATSLTNEDYYNVTVKQGILDASGNQLSTTADYTTGFLWNDTTAPTVTSVTNGLGGAITINFSKPLGTAVPQVVINGSLITLPAGAANGQFTAGDTSITILPSQLPSSVVAGSSVSVVVSGAEDQVLPTPNVMSLYSGSLNYSLKAETPVVQSLTASAENQLTLKFNEAIDHNINNVPVNTNGSADNSTVLGLNVFKNDGTQIIGATATTTDGQTFTITLPTGATTNDVNHNIFFNGSSVTLNVSVSNFEDAGNDLGTPTTQTATLTQDTSAPTLISTQYVPASTTAAAPYNEDHIVFGFSKDIKSVVGSDVTAVNNTTGQMATLGTVQAGPDGASVWVLNTPATLQPGSYTFYFAAGAVTDTSSDANANAAFTQVVTVPSTTGTTGTSVSALAAAYVPSVGNDVINVTYTAQVKGGVQAGSATDVNNYKLNGQALPTGTTITMNSGQNGVVITLPSGTEASTASEVLSVSNVQNLDGSSVPTANVLVTVTDNTAPTLQSAKVDASGNLILTFSEDIDGMNDETGTSLPTRPLAGNAASDFAVTVNGQNVTGLTIANGAAENQLKLTATGASISLASGTVVVDTIGSPTTIKDAAQNVLTGGSSVTATR